MTTTNRVRFLLATVLMACGTMAGVGLASSVQRSAPAPKQTFSIQGVVNAPGKYEWSTGLTLEKAVALAGGLKKDAGEGGASLDSARITRMVKGKQVVVPGKANTPILPDDDILIPIPKAVAVAVARRGTVA